MFKQIRLFVPLRSSIRSSHAIKYFSNLSSDDDSIKKKGTTFWEGINTLPNKITMSRIIASPFLAIAIAYDQKLLALSGCVLAGFSDWLDGYIARNYNQTSVMGAFLDPMADKIVIGSLTVGLAAKGLLPIELAALILSRDMLLLGGGFYLRYKTKLPEAYFFDTTYSTKFEVKVSPISKINTGLQFALLSTSLAHFSFSVPSLEMLEPLWWLTGATTIGSGIGYLKGAGVVFKPQQPPTSPSSSMPSNPETNTPPPNPPPPSQDSSHTK